MPEMKSNASDSKMTTSGGGVGGRGSVENRSDVDSGIDDRDYRDRRAHNMV